MFKNRRTSQRPSDDFLETFKQKFPQLNHGTAGSGAPTHEPTSLAEALDLSGHQKTLDAQAHDFKDGVHTPRGTNDGWNFGSSGLTPSIMDQNNQAFSMFPNDMQAYNAAMTPSAGLFHSTKAGDIHTPGFAWGINTPLSLAASDVAMNAGHPPMHGFQPHMPQHIQQQHFHNMNPFQVQQQPGFAPHHFTNQPSYEHLEPHLEESPVDDMHLDVNMHQEHSPHMLFHPHAMHHNMQPPRPVHPTGEDFRYHVTLNAPTAMVKHSDEIPITYLNKGQAYTLNVTDTRSHQHTGPLKYRTFVRVSFEDAEQRQKPAACWQLWKEGRGTNEAHQRGGRLQAVEYVDPGHNMNPGDPTKPQVNLEYASFDGFCVNWTPPAGVRECPISVRFNFLSTDFSHSKGVKGIPVRLCAKTEIIDAMSGSTEPSQGEVCYAKVKLFRDHGAERKLSNDVAHVKKTIEKVTSQVLQLESGIRDPGKRKRAGSIARQPTFDGRVGKAPKHRRTWSITSSGSNGGRGSAEDDLQSKLATLKDMFISPKPTSILYLHGEEGDDPDLHPVKLTGDMATLVRNDSGNTVETANWERQSSLSQTGPPSSLVSPAPSTKSLASGSRRVSCIQPSLQQQQQPTPLRSLSRTMSRMDSGEDWQEQQQTATMDLPPSSFHQHYSASPQENQPMKVQIRSPNSGAMSGWIEALGVDHNYVAPPEPAIKPVACFYIQPRIMGQAPPDNFHRAIYLFRRTVKDFVNAAAGKAGIEPTDVLQIIHITRDGIRVLFDEDHLRELREGQDMTAEFAAIRPDSPTRPGREWDVGATDIQCDGDLSVVNTVASSGYKLELLY